MAAYDRLWEDITSEHNESDMALAIRAIKWVLCAIGPLHSGTLLEAIRFSHEGECLIQTEPWTEQGILSLCQDFLTVDAEKKVWMLPHASVAKYFKSRGMVLGDCDAFVSKIMLGFLMAPGLELPTDTRVDLGMEAVDTGEYDNPKLSTRHVKNTWFQHIQRYDKWLGSLEDTCHETELTATLKRFLGSPGDSSGYYRRWMNSRTSRGVEPANMTISIMCRYGFYYALQDWWENDTIDQKLALAKCKGAAHDGYSLTINSLLSVAVTGGCMPICRYLVSAIGVAGHQEVYRQATEQAISSDDKSVVKLLVEEAKVDVNIICKGENWTLAQHTAMYDTTSGMLQWMIDQGWVDVNRQGGLRYGNALIAAANSGSPQSVDILLRAGADASAFANCGDYGSALIAAAASWRTEGADYETMMVTLLESGADITINQVPKAGHYGSALESFLCCNFYEKQPRKDPQPIRILETLLKSGADPAMTFDIGEHGSALAAAAFFGFKDFLVMMVDAVGPERAIECLQQSRHPSRIGFCISLATECEATICTARKQNIAEIATYLAEEVGVDKETLRSIGLKDVTSNYGFMRYAHQRDRFEWIFNIE